MQNLQIDLQNISTLARALCVGRGTEGISESNLIRDWGPGPSSAAHTLNMSEIEDSIWDGDVWVGMGEDTIVSFHK